MNSLLKSFFSTLRGRLILLICVATLPAMLFIFIIAQQERESALTRAQSEAHYFVDLIAREHLYQMLGAKSLLRWLTDKMEKASGSTLKSNFDSDFLSSLLAGYPQLINIAILSKSGEVMSSACSFPKGINMSNYSAIQRSLGSREVETGGYTIGPIVRRPLVHLARSVRDRTGSVLCVVFVAVDLKWLNEMTERVRAPAQHTLFIVDRNGTVLARSNPCNTDEYPVASLIPELAEKARGGRTMIQARRHGHVHTLAVAPMEELPGIIIATALPHESINRGANAIFLRMFGLLSLLTLTTGAFVVILEELTLLRWLRSLSLTAKRFGGGDYAARVSASSGTGELEDMAATFNSMADTLRARHQELEETRDRLEKSARHLQIAKEQEAQRIARDLHDEVGQVLTSIKLDLRSFEKKWAGGQEAIQDIIRISAKIDDMVKFIREIASELRPPVLDRMGLASAVEILARNTEQSGKVVIDVETSGIEEPVDWLISITLYRVAQESLTNIARHSNATEAHLRLSYSGDSYRLRIKDNGKGFNPDAADSHSLGLIGMHERCLLVGGVFNITSSPGHGTEIDVSVPRLQTGD
ncbi:MAG: HAMP domain-containing protein [Candidatus Obscuribacterales bacterium]|nr:HAMP domain-containing protein [Candidatus Obscuribacterales bacterium]HNB23169.1 histidine kinase [Candidatus Melainabacteria bacterium]